MPRPGSDDGYEELLTQPKADAEEALKQQQYLTATAVEEPPPPEEPPYSIRNEVSFFFKKGLPLGAAALLEWGFPPLMTMFFAGHVQNSADLQSALGYSRVFW